MDHYCVIGNPIQHSRSPWIHTRFAELTGQSIHYDRLLAPIDGFKAAIQALIQDGCKGCSVTVPFKFDAAALAKKTSARAQLAQAANTLSFSNGQILADNTDGAGLVRDIERNAGLPLQGLRILLIGAGGAAAGALAPLLATGPATITVANRTLNRATALVTQHAQVAEHHKTDLQASDLHEIEGAFDVVINATASSLSGAGVPVPSSTLKPGTLAYDMMYGAAALEFLTWATRHGAVARDGLGMLVEQAAEAFEIWRGVRPPSQQVLAELRSLLD